MNWRTELRRWRAATVAAVLATTALTVSITPTTASAAACETTPLELTWDSSLADGLVLDLHVRSSPLTIDWGDGTTPTSVTTLPSGPKSHTYTAGGTYTVSVCGGLTSFGRSAAIFTNRGAAGYTAVNSFPSTLTNLQGGFDGWTNLTDVPNYLPVGVTNLTGTFRDATNFNDPDIASWNTANVSLLANAFTNATSFNQPIGSWNTARVTTLYQTFLNAAAFDQPIGSWNTSSVTTMAYVFQNAPVFDQNIGAWDVSRVTTLAGAFNNAFAFNNGGSDTIRNWNTVSVTTLDSTFAKAKKFNQPIDLWNTAKVTQLSYTFAGATDFNQNIGAWNTASVTTLFSTFNSATAFNNGGSDTIKNWNTSKVTSMVGTFKATSSFNQPIGSWNVSAVTSMFLAFEDALAFDLDLSAWSPVALTNAAKAWATTNNVMSVANYDKLLLSWSGKVLKSTVTFDWGAHKYSCAAESARAKIAASPTSWVITDGGLAETAPTISTIVPADGKLSVYVTAPTCKYSQRNTYEYSLDDGNSWVTVSPASLASPIVITGLTNFTTYPVRVRIAGGTVGTALPGGPASAKYDGTPEGGAVAKAATETSVYGAAVPTIGYKAGIASGDWLGTVTCAAYTTNTYTTRVTSSTQPGTYVTHCTGSTTSGLGASVGYIDGVYTVTKAPLTITAKSFTKTYGAVLTPTGSSDFTVSGLIGVDGVDSVTLTTSGAVASAGVVGSPYSVVPSAAVGSASKVLEDWYTITYANGSITVNKAPALQVTTTSGILDAGATALATYVVPYTTTGFVAGESFTTAGYTAPTCGVYNSTNQLQSPSYSSLPVGTYKLRCSAGSAANYEAINFAEGTLVIKAVNVQVTANNATSAYGSAVVADPGYDNDGDLTNITVTCGSYTDSTYATPVTSSTMPGTYVTHCSGPALNDEDPQLAIEYSDGEYTITKVPLTVTAASHTKTYGDTITLDSDLSDGSSDVTVTGLVNGDTMDSVTLTSLGDGATAGVASSPYWVVPSAALLDCECDTTDYYDITYEKGTITVTKKTLTITANDLDLKVGNPVPTSYEFDATGLVNGENLDTDLPDGWVAPTCTSSFNSTTPLGTPVDITCTGGSADDYDFSFAKGTVSIGNPVVTVENTTRPAYETSGSTADVSLSATITDWAPGCKVTFTLSPSAGTASPYTVYTTASNDVSVSANLPVGVYDITTSVSEGCEGPADTTGFVAVVPIGPGGKAHVDTYGTRYRDNTTGKTMVLNMEWKRDLVRTKNPVTGVYESSYVNVSYYNWSIYGTKQWRIASKPFSGTVTITDGDTQSATVSTWGRMACPTGMYPANNASICSAVTNIVMLQEWVPTSSRYGYWRDIGEVLIVEKLAEGLWPYRCATLACKTALPDYVGFQMRSVPGDSTPTVIPVGLPTYTDWTRVTYGEVLHK